jgi:hypothetical protein
MLFSHKLPIRSALLGLAGLTCGASAQLLPNEKCLLLQYEAAAGTAGSAVSAIAAGDIDQDGDLDVVTADAATGTVRLLVNNGAVGFSQQALNPGVAPSALALADVDADGDLDLLVGFDTGMRWLRNDGAGHYMPVANYTFPAGDAGAVALRVADVDADRHLDAIIGLSMHAIGGGATTGGLWVALGDGTGEFQPLPTHALALRAHDITLADFDGDSFLDVAELGGYISASAVSIASGVGDGSFVNVLPTFSAGSYAGGLAAGDFDGDGDADLATGFKYSVSIRLNDGSGHFTLAQSIGGGSYVKGIAAGDVDLDGDLDLLVTSGSTQSIRLLTNDSSAHYTVGASVPASIQCYSVLLADTSGDGYLDAWAGDVVTGQLYAGLSHCLVASYGVAKLNSLGVLPALAATGTPSVSGSGFSVQATQLLPQQPALIGVGFGPLALPLLGGQLLVQAPWALFPATTSAGSGGTSDATASLPISAAQLGAVGLGTRLYVQVYSLDPLQADGTAASLSDGLRFEVAP